MTTLNRRQFLAQSAVVGGSLATGNLLLPSAAAAQDLPELGIEGYIAPELTFDYWIDKNGEPTTFSVAESKGKWVLLKFFQNWCPGCHKSGFPTLKAFADRFHDHPQVTMAGIQTVFEGYGSNTVDDVRKLQLRYDLPIAMGHDQGDHDKGELPSTMLNYRSGGTPWMVVVAPDGQVVFNHFHVDPTQLIDYISSQVA